MNVNTLNIDDASNISCYTASTCSAYSSGIKIMNNNYIVSPCEIKPDDIINIEFKIVPCNSLGIEVISRSITFNDLCTAIAKQIVVNDLRIESDN